MPTAQRPNAILSPWLACLVVFAGCAETRRAPRQRLESTPSRVDVFVRTVRPAPFPVLLELRGVALRGEDGEEHSLTLERSALDSSDLAKRRLVAGVGLPPGSYASLILDVLGAQALEPSGARSLRLIPYDTVETTPPDEASQLLPGEGGTLDGMRYEVPVSLRVGNRDAVSVFLDWDVLGSLDGTAFRPVFSLTLERPTPRIGLLYVADEASGSVVAVNRINAEVVATAKAGQGPRALTVTPDRRTLLVANGGGGSVSVIDTLQDFAVNQIPIRLRAGCSDIVLLEDQRTAVVVNRDVDTVSFVDFASSSRIADLRVGREPRRVTTAPRSRYVFVVNHVSNDLSVIDATTQRVVQTLPTESGPTDAVIDRRGRTLFVAHQNSVNLLAIDIDTLTRIGTFQVGQSCTALLADRRRDRIYVARTRPDEFVVFDSTLNAVIRRFPIEGRIEQMVQPREGPLIYGASPDRGGLVSVNVLTGRPDAFLPCGTRPMDVVAID